MSFLRSTVYRLRSNQGLTLIEALIYVVLFSVVIGGGVATAFYLVQSSSETRLQALSEAEANFVLRKVDHLLMNAGSVSVTASALTIDGDVLTACGSSICFAGDPLTSDGVEVQNITFTHIAGPPDEITMELGIGGRTYHTLKYLR
jgi:hypothetical protein